MFVGGKPDRRAENYGDAAVEVWCEGSGTAPWAPAAAPLAAAPRHPPELSADLPGLAAYSANRAAWRAACGDSGGALPLPFLRDPRSECPRLDVPFVTDEVGGLPVLPDDLEQALAAYLPEADDETSTGEGGATEAPEVGIDGSGKAAASSVRREGLRALLREADAQGQRYWAAVACPRLRQPPWWPPAACGPGGVGAGRGSVPLYDQVIVGRGATGIGMHADAYSTPADSHGGEGGEGGEDHQDGEGGEDEGGEVGCGRESSAVRCGARGTS